MQESRTPEAHCAPNGPLPLLPSGPGGVGGVWSRKTDVRPVPILPRPFLSFISAAEENPAPAQRLPSACGRQRSVTRLAQRLRPQRSVTRLTHCPAPHPFLYT